jgi:predicted RNase H-like HicB family nuclease
MSALEGLALLEGQNPTGGLLRYTVILEKGRESGFVAICPALPGCVSQGRTKRDVLRNIREAVEVYIEALLEDGLPVPVEQGREMIEIEVAAR